VEGGDTTTGPRIVGFGAAVFVKSDFIEEELRNPRPYLTDRVVESVIANRSVVLSEPELTVNNRNGGVDMVVLGTQWADQLSSEEAREVQIELETAFLKLFAAYNFRRLVTELTDAKLSEYAKRSGVWRIVKEFCGSGKSDSAGL
jgi:hypothetical protein